MCFGGGGGGQRRVAKYQSKNDAAVVTGMQTGVENPKDTKKASDKLKIQREKEEGRYVDPSIATAQKLTRNRAKACLRNIKNYRVQIAFYSCSTANNWNKLMKECVQTSCELQCI